MFKVHVRCIAGSNMCVFIGSLFVCCVAGWYIKKCRTYAKSDRFFADSLLHVTMRMCIHFMLMCWYITRFCLSDTQIHTFMSSSPGNNLISILCMRLFKSWKTNCVCFIQGLFAYCAVNVLHLGYTKPISLMLYKAKVAVCSEIRTQHINTLWAPCRIFRC
jgi:hypothetical protein